MQIVIQPKAGLNYNYMKKGILILIFLVHFSCGNKSIYSHDKNVRIYKTYSKGLYTFFEGVQQKDTTVFVINTNFLKSCNKEVNFIDKNNLTQISNLNIGESVVYFKYKMLDSNKKILVETSERPPSENTSFFINTYSKYPFYIDNCDAFR